MDNSRIAYCLKVVKKDNYRHVVFSAECSVLRIGGILLVILLGLMPTSSSHQTNVLMWWYFAYFTASANMSFTSLIVVMTQPPDYYSIYFAEIDLFLYGFVIVLTGIDCDVLLSFGSLAWPDFECRMEYTRAFVLSSYMSLGWRALHLDDAEAGC